MGDLTWAGAAAARPEHDPRSAVLSQLRPNLVRIHAAGGRSDQDPLRGPLARIRSCPGTTFEFSRLCQRLQMPTGQHHESGGKVQRVVVRRGRRCFFLYIYIAYYIVYTYRYTPYEYCRSPAATANQPTNQDDKIYDQPIWAVPIFCVFPRFTFRSLWRCNAYVLYTWLYRIIVCL